MNTCPECREGAIYSLKSAAKLHRVTHEKMLLPNGMAWNISHQIMYFADTFADAVYVYKTDSRGIPLPKKRSLAFRVHQPVGNPLDNIALPSSFGTSMSPQSTCSWDCLIALG